MPYKNWFNKDNRADTPECLKPLHYDKVQGYCPQHGEPEARKVAGSPAKAGDVLTDADIEAPTTDAGIEAPTGETG
jgi:hypothetical protein